MTQQVDLIACGGQFALVGDDMPHRPAFAVDRHLGLFELCCGFAFVVNELGGSQPVLCRAVLVHGGQSKTTHGVVGVADHTGAGFHVVDTVTFDQ